MAAAAQPGARRPARAQIYVLAQYNTTSLAHHVSSAFSFLSGISYGNGFVELLNATQTPGKTDKSAW
jgi:glucose-1-phosphate adenylyltransferase